PKIAAIREMYRGKKIIIGRDKLDVVRGVTQKLQAFYKLLADFPEWRGNVVLIQVTAPSSNTRRRALSNKSRSRASRNMSSPATFVCATCDASFARKDHLNRHVQSVHNPDYRPYVCPEEGCNAKFKQAETLQGHIIYKHRDARPFACDLCDKDFKVNSDLLKHMRGVHEDRREHSCPAKDCAAAFFVKSHLTRHVAHAHQTAKTHVCAVCGEEADTDVALVRHLHHAHADHPGLEDALADFKPRLDDGLRERVLAVLQQVEETAAGPTAGEKKEEEEEEEDEEEEEEEEGKGKGKEKEEEGKGKGKEKEKEEKTEEKEKESIAAQRTRLLAAAQEAPVGKTDDVLAFQAWITALILEQGKNDFVADPVFGVSLKDQEQHARVYATQLHAGLNVNGVPLWIALAVHLLKANEALWAAISHQAALAEKRPLSAPDLFRATLYDMEEGAGQGGVYMLTPDLAALYIGMTNDFARRASGHSNTRGPNVKYRAVQYEVLSSSLWRQRVLLDLDLPRLGLRFMETIMNFASNATAANNLNRRYIDIGSHSKKDDTDQGKDKGKGRAREPIVPHFVPLPVQRRQAQAATSAPAAGPSGTSAASSIAGPSGTSAGPSSASAGPSTASGSTLPPPTTATTEEGLRVVAEEDVALFDPRAPTTIPRKESRPPHPSQPKQVHKKRR
ncbi:hypothetical protein OC835_007460, partial [Tilletia horrida]